MFIQHQSTTVASESSASGSVSESSDRAWRMRARAGGESLRGTGSGRGRFHRPAFQGPRHGGIHIRSPYTADIACRSAIKSCSLTEAGCIPGGCPNSLHKDVRSRRSMEAAGAPCRTPPTRTSSTNRRKAWSPVRGAAPCKKARDSSVTEGMVGFCVLASEARCSPRNVPGIFWSHTSRTRRPVRVLLASLDIMQVAVECIVGQQVLGCETAAVVADQGPAGQTRPLAPCGVIALPVLRRRTCC